MGVGYDDLTYRNTFGNVSNTFGSVSDILNDTPVKQRALSYMAFWPDRQVEVLEIERIESPPNF